MDFLNDSVALSAAGQALSMILSFDRLMFLVLGVLTGLAIGLVPGVGGLTGFALLVPFTYTMDPLSAIGMLLGMHSVITTSDSLGAVGFQGVQLRRLLYSMDCRCPNAEKRRAR